MQTLLKQSIIGGLSFLLLTGIAFSVGSSEPSVFEGEAATSSATVSTRTAANITSANFSYSIFEFVVNADSAKNYAKLATNNYYQTNSNFFGTNSPTSIKITSIQIATFGTWTTGSARTATFRITLTNSGTKLTEAGSSDNYTSPSLSNTVDSTSGTYSNLTDFAISSTSGFTFDGFIIEVISFASTTTGYLRMARFTYEYTYTAQYETDSINYANNFLTATENKANCTSDSGWSTLQSDYNALSADAKTEFKTNTTNQTIVDARERYNYLIAFNNTLTDFVNAV
jgi:hypothetical protein